MPNRLVFLGAGVDLDHAPVADVDLGAASGIALQPGAEFVAFAGGIQVVKHLANGGTDEILGQFGAVLGPVGFHHPQFFLIEFEQETVFLPEIAHRAPELVGRSIDHQPALVARALDAHVAHAVDRGGALGRLGRLGRLVAAGGDHRARHVVARVPAELGQVGRHFQRAAALRGLVVDLVFLQHGATRGQRRRQRDQAKAGK